MKDKESRLVYSTDGGRVKQTATAEAVVTDGVVRIRRDTKGRKGNGVTTLTGLALTEPNLQLLSTQLKQKCSTGGTVKDGIIEIQGDHREILRVELEKRGHRVKLAGG